MLEEVFEFEDEESRFCLAVVVRSSCDNFHRDESRDFVRADRMQSPSATIMAPPPGRAGFVEYTNVDLAIALFRNIQIRKDVVVASCDRRGESGQDDK